MESASRAPSLPSSLPSPPLSPAAPPREDWIDLFRGMAILAVVFIHVLQRFFAVCPAGSASWWLLFGVHRLSFFAVPAFLLLSTVANVASLRRRFDVPRYFGARLLSVLWPYLLWSGIYIGYQEYFTPGGYRWANLGDALLYGHAWTHLYFMVVLFQVLLAAPFLVLMRRAFKRPPPFALVAPVGIASTLLVYYGNIAWFHFPRPASLMVWHLPVITMGCWLGWDSDRTTVKHRLQAALIPALVIGVFGGVFYVMRTGDMALRNDNNLMGYQFAEWVYVTAISVLLLGVASGWDRRPGGGGPGVRRAFQTLGRYSLQIYLVHPLFLILFDALRPGVEASFGAWGSLFVCLAAAFLGPLAVAVMANFLNITGFLFGRAAGNERMPPPPVRPETTPLPNGVGFASGWKNIMPPAQHAQHRAAERETILAHPLPTQRQPPKTRPAGRPIDPEEWEIDFDGVRTEQMTKQASSSLS